MNSGIIATHFGKEASEIVNTFLKGSKVIGDIKPNGLISKHVGDATDAAKTLTGDSRISEEVIKYHNLGSDALANYNQALVEIA